MPRVELTNHLYAFFPVLEGGHEVAAGTVKDVIAELESKAPGFAFYVCDEAGRMRQHVNVFVDGERIRDRGTLKDPVGPDSRVVIVQALSGG